MSDPGDKLFIARLEDMVSRSERDGCAVFSSFFDERQCAEAEAWCRFNAGGLKYALWGGFPEARRKMLAVYPDYLEECIPGDMPMKCITFTYRTEDNLTHRDFLGTFMGMQLKRETVGDIITAQGKAQAFVTDVAARLLVSSVSKIGRTGVKVTDAQPFDIEVKQDFKIITGTVASLRLDCVVSLAANVSRENAARLIRSEKVDVDHITAHSVSAELAEGNIISIRGCGRFILSGINGSTKKGRIHIELKKYI